MDGKELSRTLRRGRGRVHLMSGYPIQGCVDKGDYQEILRLAKAPRR